MTTERKYPDRYVITGLVKEGKHKGERVWLYWTTEGGGWWQWGQESWAHRFSSKRGECFEDALWCAQNGAGPWYYDADPNTVEVVGVPAIVEVTVR